MDDEEEIEEVVGDFMLKTCRMRAQYGVNVLSALVPAIFKLNWHKQRVIRSGMVTGSVAEFYIEPMLPLSGDIDIMMNSSAELAIPRGHAPPTELPSDVEWNHEITVYEIVDSEFPGYVYLSASHILSLNSDTGAYTAADIKQHKYFRRSRYDLRGMATVQNLRSSLSYNNQDVHIVQALKRMVPSSGHQADETFQQPTSSRQTTHQTDLTKAASVKSFNFSFDNELEGIAVQSQDMIRSLQRIHGPALQSSQLLLMNIRYSPADQFLPTMQAMIEQSNCYNKFQHIDYVPAVRCLAWPVQAAGWPTRQRCDWPDSETVEKVVCDGCDVVGVPHRLCREDKWASTHQFRLSFSRAEIVLLNSWSPVQQIIYHMLRVFLKEERVTEGTDGSPEEHHLSNYHLKTLMLWTCELKKHSFWSLETNSLFKLFRKLLFTLSVWTSDKRCQHFFVSNCNLLSQLYNSPNVDIFSFRFRSLLSSTKLGSRFLETYVRKCLNQCPEVISHLFDVQGQLKQGLKCAVNAIVAWRASILPHGTHEDFASGEILMALAARISATSAGRWRSYLTNELCRFCPQFSVYFSGLITSRLAYEIGNEISDDLLDSLWIMFAAHLNTYDLRKRGSVAATDKALVLIRAASDRSITVEHVQVEMSKAYLYRALKCRDSDRNSIHCLAHAILAVLYRFTKQHQTALKHYTQAKAPSAGSQTTPIAGHHLINISGNIDNVRGLIQFYEYLRTSAGKNPNRATNRSAIAVFVPQLLATAAYSEILSFENASPDSHQKDSIDASAAAIQLNPLRVIYDYRITITRTHHLYIADVLLFKVLARNSRGVYGNSLDGLRGIGSLSTLDRDHNNVPQHLNTSRLVELLTQYAFEQLIEFRQLKRREVGDKLIIITHDFEALYAYKRGLYDKCAQLCRKDTFKSFASYFLPLAFPEFVHLLDDKLVSLNGLIQTVLHLSNSTTYGAFAALVSQSSLLLHLLTECQLKLDSSPQSLIDIMRWISLCNRNASGFLLLDKSLLTLTYRKTRFHLSKMLTVR